MALVRPRDAFVSMAFGLPVVLAPSDLLEDDDDHVRAHPDMFAPVVATVRGMTTAIEQATAAPGEVRKAVRK